jgi:uncharacterized protein (TIGR02453 family)
MKEIIEFLQQIAMNNNREWFNNHKNDYLFAQNTFNNIAQKLILGVGEFDYHCKNLTLRDCTYRFYRDIRFSKDKSPYKNHFGVFVCEGGKKSMKAGYYFHIEPQGGTYLQGSMLCCGSYCPTPQMLKSVREDIVDYGKDFEKSIKKASHFYLEKDNSLIKNPKGFENTKYDYLLRLKNYLVTMPMDDNFLMSDNLIENVLNEFYSAKDFVELINRAIDYEEENNENIF